MSPDEMRKPENRTCQECLGQKKVKDIFGEEMDCPRCYLTNQWNTACEDWSAYHAQEIEKYKDAVEDMVNQFAYDGSPVRGVTAITTGGLSALENAFEVLGYSDPQLMPHKQCQYPAKPKCTNHATCGTPTKKFGYLRICGEHYGVIEKEDL